MKNPYLCSCVSRNGAETVLIAMYVDDILIAAKTDGKMTEVKAAIIDHFDVKDLGELHFFLGVKVFQDQKTSTIWLGQPVYSENIIQQSNM